MAFSMFIRNTVCRRTTFRQQAMQLATRSTLQRPVAACLPIRTLALNEAKTTPIMNSIRSFRTTSVRRADEKPHDHARLWVVEKATAALLVPLVPLALAMPNKILDGVVAVLIVAHSFWGLEAVAVDYVRASIFGPVIPKIAIGLVYLISIATLGGLFYIITHDIGIANSIRQLWSIKSEQKA